MCRCLFCYRELTKGEIDFHQECVKKFFGTTSVPILDYSKSDMDALASQIIKAQTTLTGVQPKLSLHLDKHRNSQKLTIVGLWGDYIFKPQTDVFSQLPENEDLTMHLAQIAKVKVVPHSLIRMKDGSLGYLTKRIDRTSNGKKIAMEDMCQLCERQTEHKYKSSYEQIAKVIRRYSATPSIDVIDFLEIVYFSWLTGNNDMHLKNFSLFCPDKEYHLSPAYDMLNVVIANPSDNEELALSLNGKRKKITCSDFEVAFETCGVLPKVFSNFKKKYIRLLPKFYETIDMSFLNERGKEEYKGLLDKRLSEC